MCVRFGFLFIMTSTFAVRVNTHLCMHGPALFYQTKAVIHELYMYETAL